MGATYHRAWVLYYEMKRYDLADRELRGVLVDHPDDPWSHALLALCLTQRRHYPEAASEIREAIRLSPNMAFAHYARARLLGARNLLGAAKSAIDEAIRLDPVQADYFSWLSAFRYDTGHWRDALQAAERGLELEPLHVSCANLRALALAKIGRRDEARSTSLAALARDPENAVTHAIQGTTLLRQAEYDQAQVHFREALRLDPMCEWAHRGRRAALIGRVLTSVPRTLGGWLLRLWSGRSPEEFSGSSTTVWLGSHALLALNAAAILAVTRETGLAAFSWVYGLIVLAFLWACGHTRGFLSDLLRFLGLVLAFSCISLPMLAVEVSSWPGATTRAGLSTYAALAVVVLGIGSLVLFFLGVGLSGRLGDSSLPRRK